MYKVSFVIEVKQMKIPVTKTFRHLEDATKEMEVLREFGIKEIKLKGGNKSE